MNAKNRVSLALSSALSAASMCLGLVCAPAHAYELYSQDGLDLSANLTIAVGAISSEKSYSTVGLRTEDERQTWYEGYAKYGLAAEYTPGNAGTFFGALGLYSGINRGDGGAAGITTGDEEDTALDVAYVGWRSGDLFPALGEDGVKISVGRQFFQIGSGFLIGGDRVNLGEGFAEAIPATPAGTARGGGAYYLGGFASFRNTAILSLGGNGGLHADLFWLESGNNYQGDGSFAGANLEYRDQTYGTIGFTYLRGLHVQDNEAAFFARFYREDQNIWSVRGQTSLGLAGLFLAGQYVHEDDGNDDVAADHEAHAWYGQAGWTFSNVTWTPALTYRFSSFSKHYDPLFYGFNDFGTWYQGEVAANYAGPFSANTDIHLVRMTVNPTKKLVVGVNYFAFTDTAGGGSNLDADELDLYAWWSVLPHVTISPLIGFYKPEKAAAEGGTQIGDDDTNTYVQLILLLTF